jgi:hypothetical protein
VLLCSSSSSSDHIVDRLCSRIASASAALHAAYNPVAPPCPPGLPYWSGCASVCQWFVRSVISCHLSPLPPGTCPSPPFLLPSQPTHINMPACVKVSLLNFIHNWHSVSMPHRNSHPSAAMRALVAHVVAVCRPRSCSMQPLSSSATLISSLTPCTASASPSNPFICRIPRSYK